MRRQFSQLRNKANNDTRSSMYFKYWTLFALFVLASTDIAADTIKTSKNINTSLTQSEVQNAAVWDLTHEEYAQLKHLKTQYQGLLSADLTPLEWLGIFATNNEQRNHYARKFAHLQLETTAAILEFEAAYANAINALSTNSTESTPDADRLLLVMTSLQCSDVRCTDQTTRGLDHVNQGGTLEIYVQDDFGSADVRTWMVTNQVPFKFLQKGNITVLKAKGRMLDVEPGIYQVKTAHKKQQWVKD